jgi:hypothetical protein
MMPGMREMDNVVTVDDMNHASLVLRDFCDMEPNFMAYLQDENNWDHEGEDDDGNWMPHRWMPDSEKDCGCGGH